MTTPLNDPASDRPIESLSEDKFERSTFAQELARAVAQRKGRESFIVGLQGPWGCGKSSIKNMVLDSLDQMEDRNRPIVIEFEPWQLRDADSLFSSFFAELALAIGQQKGDNEERQQRLRAYSKSLALGGSVVKNLGVLAGITGIPLAKLIELMGEKMGEASKIAEQGADAIPEDAKSLKQKKKDLSVLLQTLERPVLVIIDDIDRLEVDEMLLIFQLVKANANFPNFTYMLLLQRDLIEDALQIRFGKYGKNYLDKIIQLPIDVPPVSDRQLCKLLVEDVDKLLRSWGLTLSQDQRDDLNFLWDLGLKGVLAQPRDVIRLLNALDFSLGVMRGEAGLEVNLADFLALESLRVTEARTYGKLPSAKALFLDTRMDPLSVLWESGRYGEKKKEEVQEQRRQTQVEMDTFLKGVPEEREQSVRAILTFIFPSAAQSLRAQEAAKELSIYRRKDTRMSADQTFDRYFALTIPEDQISQAEIQAFIASANDETALGKQLEGFKKRDLLSNILMEVTLRAENIPFAQRESFVLSLLRFSTRNSYSDRLMPLFSELLQLEPDVTKRGKFFKSIIPQSSQDGIFAYWIATQENAARRGDLRPWATTDQLKELRDLLTDRIAQDVRTDEFWEMIYTHTAIGFWATSKPDEVKAYVKESVDQDVDLLTFLRRFRQTNTVIGGPLVPFEVDFDPKMLALIDDLPRLQDRVNSLDTSGWNAQDRATAKAFVSGQSEMIEQDDEPF